MWRRALVLAALGTLGCGVFASGLPLCPFARGIGHPCPGCGLTRATLAALSGDFGRAFALQPYAFVATPLFAALIVAVAARYLVTGKPSLGRFAEKTLFPAAGALFLAMLWFWVARFCGAWGGPVPVG